MPLQKTILFLIIFHAFFSGLYAQSPQYDEVTLNRKVDSVLRLMTLEEKIGQMNLLTSDYDVTGPFMKPTYLDDVKKGRTGAIFNALGVSYIRQLQQLVMDNTRLKIPMIFGYDVIHGYKTSFPIPLAQACSWNLADIEKSERISAIEATAVGLNWVFAPMVDIARDPRWGRICEGAGEDTWLGSKIAAARVKGFQGESLAENNTVVACVKHYAAYGAAFAGRDYNTTDMSDRTLHEIYLPPFKAALDAGAGTIMTAFNELNGIPATGNHYLLNKILKTKWHFNGFVVTDYTSVEEMVNHGNVAHSKEAGEVALNAGVDMDMQSDIFSKYLAQSVKEEKVNPAAIDEAVRRILRIKFMLGLFDDPFLYCDEERERNLLLHPDHLAFARKFASKSVVLLKNDGNILPLPKKEMTIALIGPLADASGEMLGAWYAQGEPGNSVSFLQGIKNVAPEVEILYAKGCEIEGTNTEGFAEAIGKAEKSDVVVLAIGEAAWMSGENTSRSEIDIPGVQSALFKALKETGKPVIVLLSNGRPLDISYLAQQADAILETWFLGTTAGNAVADVLFGDYNPSGKLTVTFPRNLGQVPIFYNAKNTGRPTNDDRYSTRYLDVASTPLFPFGFGLSYTTFDYSNLVLSKENLHRGDILKIAVNVTNTGNLAGEETTQLYIRDLVGSVTRPVKELKGFTKVFLQPGESQKVEFLLSDEDLKFYDINMNWVAESGDFEVFVGSNSQQTLSARFTFIQ